MAIKELIKKNYAEIDKNATISELIGTLIRKRQKAAVVFDKRKYVGITTKRLLLKTKIDPSKLKVNKVTVKVPSLTGEEDIEEIARLLYTSDAPLLPVVQNNKVIGIIRSIDVVNRLPSESKKKKVNEIMSLNPIAIDEDAGVGEAISKMRENKVSRIPVVGRKGKIIALTSMTDVLRNYEMFLQGKGEQGVKKSGRGIKSGAVDVGGKEYNFNNYPAVNLTSPITITGKENETVSKILDKMNEFNISSLVIVRENKPVGIVTVRDLLKLLMKGRITY